MTLTLKVHYDGHVFVPDEPVDLPVGYTLDIQVHQQDSQTLAEFPLLELAKIGSLFPSDKKMPTDGAANIEHYLYGAEKQT